MQAVLKAQINKTGNPDDARGIAQMTRVGLYRPVHVKTLRSQKLRMMLTHRKLLQSKAIAIENDLRVLYATSVSRLKWPEDEVRGAHKELVENLPDLAELVLLNQCSLSGGRCANRSSSCIAVYWPSSAMTRCAGA